MQSWRWSLVKFLNALIVNAFLCLQVIAGTDVLLTTENYPPFNYEENGEVKGTVTERVTALLHAADVSFEIEVLPWNRAYKKALLEKNVCVYTTARTQERESLFEWVSPFIMNNSVLVKHERSLIRPNNLKHALTLKIGMQSGYVAERHLMKMGADPRNFHRSVDLEAPLNMLLLGRIDLLAMAESRYHKLKEEHPIEKAFILFEMEMGLACNKETDLDLLARMRAELKKRPYQ